MKKPILVTVFLVLAAVMFVKARAEDVNIADNTRDLFKEVQLFADSITLISADYVEPVKMKDLVYGAIRGMAGILDGYSQFLDPDDFREISEETRGSFGGVGIEIGVRDGILTVIAPIADTPAEKAGLLAGDMIVKIDDEVTRDLDLDESVKKLRGEPGTEVKISVLREGSDKILDFTITRAIIKMKSLKDARMLEDGIGYIRITEFQEPSAKDLKKKMKELKKEGADNLIIDVRNNPGGLLDAAIEVSELFLEPGALIVSTEGRDPEKRVEFRAKKTSDFTDIDMIVLVNKGSASAAEIFAGAMQDNNRALIVGEQTFGKGSVQTVIPLKDGSAIRLTTAAYLTPAGRNLRDKGVEPDIAVTLVREEKAVPPEDEAGNDKKMEVFGKVDGKKREDGADDGDPDKDEFRMDNQLRTAVNVIKGVKIFTERTGKQAPGGNGLEQ